MDLPTALTTHRPAPDRPHLALEVEALPDAIMPLRGEITRLAEVAGLGRDRTADATLAVTEACANAVIHAYVGREPGTIGVTGEITERGLEVRVADKGRGMTSRADSPGLGLGLPLMASLTTEVEFASGPDGGTEIWMLFATTGPGALSWAQTG